MSVPANESTTSPALLAGRYQLQERLGAGGMAEVWLARDTLLARPVAVKLLDPGLAADPSLVDQFKREAQSAASLNHPNIVAVYDWGRGGSSDDGAGDTYFLVMEYVPGSNLKDLVRRRGALPEATGLRLADQVAAALEAAHQHGVVHCDVKPHNVLLDAHGRPKVADFGLACAIGLAEVEAGRVVGSAHYLAPERARGGAVDPRSDIYGLGAVLFELLTGHVPFEGESVQAVVRRHLEEAPPSPRVHEAAVSPLSEAIVLRCLAKEPADRYQSAAELRDALADAQAALLASLELTQPLPTVPHGTSGGGASLPPPGRGGAALGGAASAAGAAVAGAGARLAAGARGRALAGRGALWWIIPAVAVLLLALAAAQLRAPAGGTPTAVAGVQATPAGKPSAPASKPVALSADAPARAAAPSADAPAKAAAPCQFVLGFKQLREKIGDVAGDCVENERPDPRTGDTVQRTSKGLFTYSRLDQIVRYTDGNRTWIDGPFGLQVRNNNERFRWELTGL